MDSEKQMLGDLARIGRTQPHWEAVQFRQAFHEQAGLQHLVGKVLCLNSQAKTILMSFSFCAKSLCRA
jgi:hypothetical protein